MFWEHGVVGSNPVIPMVMGVYIVYMYFIEEKGVGLVAYYKFLRNEINRWFNLFRKFDSHLS